MSTPTPVPYISWFPSWLTLNYLIDTARYVAAGVKGQKGAKG